MIVVAVRWYLRYGVSYRDVEELLVERGIEVDHVIIFRWVQRFTPLLVDAARPCRHSVGTRWFVTPGPIGSVGGGIAVLDDEKDDVVVTVYDGAGKPSHREVLATVRAKMRVRGADS